VSLFELFVLAVGLCMDSFAVSLTSGVLLKPFTLSRVLKIAAFMAVFQGAMPLIGWFLGIGFKNYIEAYDHWVAFGVLLFLGMKMIYEGWLRKGESEPCCIDPADTRTLVGLSFAFLNMTMIAPTIVIAGVTFAFSLVGVYIGRQFGRRIHNFAEVVGGVILIGIGVKILLEHLFF
jgi:putative Mn2+ efflux pump MntP